MSTITPRPIPSELLPFVRDGRVLAMRTATLTRREAAVSPEDGARPRYRLSCSSEAPVLRYDWMNDEYYYEVLSHDAAHVDLTRARDGLAFLLEHTRWWQLGRVFDVALDAGARTLVGDLQFSRDPEIRRYEMDVEDGIRRDVSVGYLVGDEYTQEKREGVDHPVRTYRAWTPFEVSLVSMPADPTVGFGRSAHGRARPSPTAGQAKEHRTMAVEVSPGTDPAGPRADDTREATRYEQAVTLCEAARINDLTFVRDLAGSELSFTEMAAKVRAKQEETQRNLPSPVALTDAEQERYSLARAIQAVMDKRHDGFEFEVSQEIEKRHGQPKHGGFYMPTTGSRAFTRSGPSLAATIEAARSLDPAVAMAAQRTLYQISGAGAPTKGGEFLFTEYGGFIDLLRTRMVINRLGVQFLTGLRGNVGFVRDTADHAFVWTDEVTNTPNTSGTFGAFTMQPRTGQSATRFTRQLLRQAPESIENLIRNKVASIHARGVQRAALFGSGTGNEPRGIANTPGVNTVPAPGLGANGGAPTYDFMVDHETEIFVDDADVDGMGYVTSARVRGRLKKTQQFASTNGLAVWSGGVQGEVNGYAAYATNDVRTDRTKGSGVNLHEVYFGAWPKLMIGEWGVTEITVDELTEAPTRVKVMGYQLIDVGIETPSSFCYSAEAAP